MFVKKHEHQFQEIEKWAFKSVDNYCQDTTMPTMKFSHIPYPWFLVGFLTPKEHGVEQSRNYNNFHTFNWGHYSGC